MNLLQKIYFIVVDKKAIYFILLSLILGIVVRLYNLSLLGETGFIGPDSARFIRQMNLISESGNIPKCDNMRSVPLGGLGFYQLTFFPYAIVWLYQVLRFFKFQADLNQIAIISPIILFTFAGLVLYFLTRKIFDKHVALLCLNIAVISPVLTRRTMAGYVDRDAICLFLGLLSYYFYIKSYHSSVLKRRLLFTFISGFIMGILGITWQGVAIFSIVIVGVEAVHLLLYGYSRKIFMLTFVGLYQCC